jgi:hypothetical protein
MMSIALWSGRQAGWTGLVAKTIQLYGLQDPERLLEVGRQAAFVRGEQAATAK